jgi:hypothetical protein
VNHWEYEYLLEDQRSRFQVGEVTVTSGGVNIAAVVYTDGPYFPDTSTTYLSSAILILDYVDEEKPPLSSGSVLPVVFTARLSRARSMQLARRWQEVAGDPLSQADLLNHLLFAPDAPR